MPKPPDLDASGQAVSGKPPDLDAQGQPVQDAGFWEGVKHMLPTPSNLLASAKAIPGNINHSLSPTALEDTMANFPNTPGGKIFHGRPMEGLGELVSGIGQMAIPTAIGRIRSSFTPPPPEMLGGVPVADLQAQGVGNQSLDLMRNGRPKPAPTQGRIQTQTAPPPQAPTYPTAGSSALQPEYQPVDAPVAAPQPAQPQGAISQTRQMELMQKFGGTAEAPRPPVVGRSTPAAPPQAPPVITPEIAELQQRVSGLKERLQQARQNAQMEEGSIGPAHQHLQQVEKLSKAAGMRLSAALKAAPREAPALPPVESPAIGQSLPLGQPRIMSVKETPTSWTPEAARARLEYNDWHSGAEPGSPEAKSAQALHRYEAETQSRYKYLLDSPNGSISPTLAAKMGIPAKYALAGVASKQMGLPAWAGPAGLGAIDLVRAYPEGSMEALRAALIAQMSSHGGGAQR